MRFPLCVRAISPFPLFPFPKSGVRHCVGRVTARFFWYFPPISLKSPIFSIFPPFSAFSLDANQRNP